MANLSDSNHTSASDNTYVEIASGDQSGYIADVTSDNRLKVDAAISIYNTNPIMGRFEYKIHTGGAYRISDLVTINAGHIKYYLISVPTGYDIHFYSELNTSEQGKMILYEEPTATGDGNYLANINYKRSSSNTSGLTIQGVSGTPSSLGTILWTFLFGSKGNSTVGFSGSEINGFVLKENTQYLIIIESYANGNILNPQFTWYEEWEIAE